MIAEYEKFTDRADAAFDAIRDHWRLLLPISLLFDGLGSAIVEWVLPSDDPLLNFGSFAVNMMLTSLIGFFASFAISRTLWRITCGKPIDSKSALLLPRAELWLCFLVGVLFALLQTVATVLLIVPAIVLSVFLLVVGPVAAVEQPGTVESLRRAWELGRGFRWQSAGILFVVMALYIIAMIPAAFLFDMESVGGTMLIVLFASPAALYGDVLVFLFYTDLRIRKESLDLELLARQVEGTH